MNLRETINVSYLLSTKGAEKMTEITDDTPAPEIMFKSWITVDARFKCPDCGPHIVRDPKHNSHWACVRCGRESYSPSLFFIDTENDGGDDDFNEMENPSCI